jgi:multiple sugar transport system permease protein
MYFSKDFPLSVRLAEMESSLRIAGYGTGDSVQLYIMAACLLFVLPVLIMYLFLQKKFIESVDRIGIVG